MRFFLTVVFLFCIGALMAQQQSSLDSLNRRIDSLEYQVRLMNNQLDFHLPGNRTQTRQNIEQGELVGVVYSSTDSVILQIGGFIQTDAIYDRNTSGSKYAFLPSSINTTPGPTNRNLYFSARQSRLTILSSFPLSKNKIKTWLEIDFFTDDSNPRVRHLYGEVNNFGIGLTFSNFIALEAFPNVIDFNGPNSIIITRNILLKYSIPLPNWHHKLAVSMEYDPFDLDLAPPLESSFTMPSSVLTYRYYFEKESFLFLSGIVRDISYQDSTRVKAHTIGWGLNFSGVFKVINEDQLSFQFGIGEGISSYFTDLSGYGIDANILANGDLKPVRASGGFVAYNHWWSNKLSSALTASYVDVSNNTNLSLPYQRAFQGAANLLFYPFKTVKSGVEFMYGNLKQIDGSQGDDFRIQVSATFLF